MREVALPRLATAALALSAALVLASCASQAPETPPTTTVQATQTAADAATPTPTITEASEAPLESEAAVEDAEVPDGRVDAAAAVEAALAAVPGDVVELELGRERITIVWEVGVLGADGSGTEVKIDSASGDVLRQETLRLSTEQRTAPTVSAAEAIGIAVDAADGRVKAMDLDTDRGMVVWEVEVLGTGGGTELYIDAESGDVVKQERMS